jgi:ComF family protein
MPPACLVCGRPGVSWAVCLGCREVSRLDYIWTAGVHEGSLAKVIQLLKFGRVRAAHETLGEMMTEAFPFADWLVVPVPTAPARIRQRGYDQSVLLARFIAQQRKNVFSPALLRVQDVRQVGKNRMQRQKQSAQMFCMTRGRDVRGAKVLLVDDVCTTASTLSAAAHVLRAAGAAEVSAVVAAWRPPRGMSGGPN